MMERMVCITIAMVITHSLAVCQAVCSPCPFQWTEFRRHCYRYFPEALSHDAAEVHCRRFATGRGAGDLTAIGSPEEALFVMEHAGNIINVTKPFSPPDRVWLRNESRRMYDNHNLIYYNALSADVQPGGYVTSCNTSRLLANVLLSDQGTGVSKMIPAPEVVEHNCAVYTGEGAYLDLGDFASTCVSDPDVCSSESVSWSIWLKINSSVALTGQKVFVSTGGQTRNGRGIVFTYSDPHGSNFLFGVRSLRKLVTLYRKFSPDKIPMDSWFHLAATVDLSKSPVEVAVYLNGNLLPEDGNATADISQEDKCTRLFLGHYNPCDGIVPPSSVDNGGSAAYSNLMVFDNLLTPGEIGYLHACGSLDWDLKVRSLYANDTNLYSDRLRYVCTASGVSGPVIFWKVYHKGQARWRDLGSSSGGEGYEIIPASFSSCVVQSTLEVERALAPTFEGDVISCTASSGSVNASVYVHQGKEMTITCSDHGSQGLYVTAAGKPSFYKNIPATTAVDGEGREPSPFICEKAGRYGQDLTND